MLCPVTEVIIDQIPTYRNNISPESYSKDLLQKTKLSKEEIMNVLKKLQSIKSKRLWLSLLSDINFLAKNSA